jgi:hypothetical protein
MEAMIMQQENSLPQAKTATQDTLMTRQAQEVQAAMVIAKKFPRDEIDSINRIARACQRPKLAEKAMYEYPRGGQKVTGPSIRLAEAIAQNWGNIDFGFIELGQQNGESQVMAYAWDLETNTRQTKVFSVKHIRATKKGDYALTDPRDIYELIANQAARRVRSCILGVVPGDVIEDAVEECKKTLKGANKTPLIDRIRKGVKLFEDNYSVSQEMLEKFIGCKAESFSENDMIRLNGVYTSLKDGMSKREDWFDIGIDMKEEKSDVIDPFEQAEQEKKSAKKAKKEEEKPGDAE